MDWFVFGVSRIEIQNEGSSGTIFPPVLPNQLVKLRGFEFNEIVSEQEERIGIPEIVERIQNEHRQLLLAHRANETLQKAIEDSNDATSFEKGWESVGNARFPALQKFCGGLASVFPGTASVESDFSLVNYEKDQYRSKLSDFSLEGILHAKQMETVGKITIN